MWFTVWSSTYIYTIVTHVWMIQLLQWCMKLRLWGFDKHTRQAVFSLLKLAEFGPLHKFIAVFAETLDFPFWPVWYAALYSVCCAGFFPLPSLCRASCYILCLFLLSPCLCPTTAFIGAKKGTGSVLRKLVFLFKHRDSLPVWHLPVSILLDKHKMHLQILPVYSVLKLVSLC